MPSYAHKKLIDEIARLDRLPRAPTEFEEWIEAGQHLKFLHTNARQDEVIVYASGPYAYIYSMVVPNSLLVPPDENDLLRWSANPYQGSAASYVTGGGREGMWIEYGEHGVGSKTLDKGKRLIYGREFHGWKGPEGSYIELAQEYSHLSGIHWRPEERAYCRYDDNGDLHHSVSVTVRADSNEVSLTSFDWSPLQEYLAASDSSLVRMFDFMLLDREKFTDWGPAPKQVISNGAGFFYRQKIIPGMGAYTRGVQILGLRRPASEIFKDVSDGWSGKSDNQHAVFIAQDWRNKVVANISTEPTATTNYFEAQSNSLPFETSPAFFKPEVLLKYKTDRDKYTVEDRTISCRAAWYLKGYDVNDAGQVHAYICDLRELPYTEQLHWVSFNEPPKDGISERAFINDFKGEWTKTTKPLQKIISILHGWRDKKVAWWTLREMGLFDRVTVPYSASRDEWADSFMDLAKLVNEGFEIKPIRQHLTLVGAKYEEKDQSIALLEKLATHEYGDEPVTFPALRTVQRIRSKVKGHPGSNEAIEIPRDALAAHGSFAKHFEAVAENVASELESIGNLFDLKSDAIE
jgi:hypothetical protein